MTGINIIERAWNCQQTLTKLFYYLDEKQYDDLLSIFEQDGIWFRQGKVLEGHSAIMAAMQARSATYAIRHMVSNFLVTQVDGDVVEVVSYLTAYANDNGVKPEKPVTIRAPMSIFVVKAKLRYSPIGIKVIELDLVPEFIFSNAV